MFGKNKEKQGLFNVMDDSRVEVNDFRRRYCYESYRPVDYKLYPMLTEEIMIPKLDHHLAELFRGDVDDANGDMLDNIIFSAYREAFSNLGIQRENHKDINRRLIAKRISDREDFIRICDNRREELTHLEQEFEDTCKQMKDVKEA